MIRCTRTLSLGLTLLALAGCLPEVKVLWSPDGRQAAVLAPDGLYLCDAEGRLSARVAEQVGTAAWTADSKRLVVVRQVDLATWQEATALLEEGQIADLTAVARRLKEEILAFKGPFDKFEPKSISELSGTQLLLAALYMRDNLPEGLPERLGAEKWADLKKAKGTASLVEVGDVADGKVTFLPPVLRTLDSLEFLRMSPNGRSVACVGRSAMVRGDDRALFVVSLAGGPLRQVAEWVSPHPDWSGDGRYLVYGRATTPKAPGRSDLRLGTISRREVAGADGGLLEKFADAEDLAGLVFHDTLKVRWLRDDRVLFDAGAVGLPCTAADLPQKPELFTLDLRRPAGIGRVLPPGTQAELPQGAAWFEVSPDQQRVLIQGPQGVAIIALADGRLETMLAESQKDLMHVPVWRSADTVCLAVNPESKLGSPKRPEVVLWSPQGSKVLSKTWPDALINGLLRPPRAESPKPPEKEKPVEDKAKPAEAQAR